ncbi:hypothetical protein Hanom_Chr06g00511851 [Helianthus anomalus]
MKSCPFKLTKITAPMAVQNSYWQFFCWWFCSIHFYPMFYLLMILLHTFLPHDLGSSHVLISKSKQS